MFLPMFPSISLSMSLMSVTRLFALRGRCWHPVLAGLMILGLAGCANTFERLSQVGEVPPLSQITNPKEAPHFRPVSLPMPPAEAMEPKANSLWRPGARAFFRDQRANTIGDILTVVIDINDRAVLSNTSDRTRKTTENDQITSALGLERAAERLMPKAFNPANPINISGDSLHRGTGSINRDEKIELKVAAIVTQILPNGNLVITGRQEVRVNYEVRELLINGIVRREDIASTNTITYDKVAEARISYGGRGQITDVQQPRYGTQILDIIYPF